ncbi:hypothetical protein CDL12_25149 [Handroanthus impetiginosus]|uniref:Phloem protein n=1 Tax=Handroanthus impetiginosus TaxID=429701 RepID=A0A2G9GAM9_9LAMI|nr:hypothetical protein CDL12_25149 [Handroanthus impetiginosus]
MASYASPHHLGNPPAKYEGKQIKILPKNLNIVWGGDNRYWTVPNDNSTAVLHQVCWLEITGSVEETSPKKNYEVGFKISFAPDAFGWGNSPIYIMVKRGKDGKFVWKKYTLNPNEKGQFDITGRLMKADDSSQASNDNKLYFGLYEVWSGKWKGGLKIHHAFVRELPN